MAPVSHLVLERAGAEDLCELAPGAGLHTEQRQGPSEGSGGPWSPQGLLSGEQGGKPQEASGQLLQGRPWHKAVTLTRHAKRGPAPESWAWAAA